MRDDELPVALILGASVRPDGEPSPALRRRSLAGAALWHAGAVRAVIGSGGPGQSGRNEAEAILRLCVDAGVPPEVCHAEPAAANTLENLSFSRPILQALGATELIVVSDAYHLPRALLIARRLGIAARGHAVPMRGVTPRALLRNLLREIPALVHCWLTGVGRLSRTPSDQ